MPAEDVKTGAQGAAVVPAAARERSHEARRNWVPGGVLRIVRVDEEGHGTLVASSTNKVPPAAPLGSPALPGWHHTSRFWTAMQSCEVAWLLLLV